MPRTRSGRDTAIAPDPQEKPLRASRTERPRKPAQRVAKSDANSQRPTRRKSGAARTKPAGNQRRRVLGANDPAAPAHKRARRAPRRPRSNAPALSTPPTDPDGGAGSDPLAADPIGPPSSNTRSRLYRAGLFPLAGLPYTNPPPAPPGPLGSLQPLPCLVRTPPDSDEDDASNRPPTSPPPPYTTATALTRTPINAQAAAAVTAINSAQHLAHGRVNAAGGLNIWLRLPHNNLTAPAPPAPPTAQGWVNPTTGQVGVRFNLTGSLPTYDAATLDPPPSYPSSSGSSSSSASSSENSDLSSPPSSPSSQVAERGSSSRSSSPPERSDKGEGRPAPVAMRLSLNTGLSG